MPDQKHYAEAISEILSQKVSLGIFAECFAMSEGNEQKTKAAYIEKRAKELEEQDLLIEKAVREQESAIKETEKKAKQHKQTIFKQEHDFQRFKEENQDKIMFEYFNQSQIKQMHEKWLEDKLRSAGLI